MAKDIHNKVMRGTFGKLYMNNVEVSEIKSFEVKASMKYEELQINGELATQHRFTGYSISGTMVKHKVNSYNTALVMAGLKTGQLPDIKFVGTLADPDSQGAETVEVWNVVLDETTLLAFENGKAGEESTPFKAGGFRMLSTVS